jgi:hypothetical protein
LGHCTVLELKLCSVKYIVQCSTDKLIAAHAILPRNWIESDARAK